MFAWAAFEVHAVEGSGASGQGRENKANPFFLM